MIKPGYIEITDKVRFVYHELEKPKMSDFLIFAYLGKMSNVPISGKVLDTKKYEKAIDEYEASKQTIEVSNAKKCENTDEICVIFLDINLDFPDHFVKNNQPCRGKIENNKAEILEIL